MENQYSTFAYHSSSFNTACINKVVVDSLCCMDGGKSLPATIRQGHAKACRMVCKEVHTGFIRKALIAD